MGIFKKKPIESFNKIYLHQKVMLFKMFNMLSSTIPEITLQIHEDGIIKSDFSKLAAQGVDYLLGERTDVPTGDIDRKELVEKLYSESMDEMRPMVDALRNWKFETLKELLGDEWTDSEEAKRLAQLISKGDESIKQSEGYVHYMELLKDLKL